MTAKEALLKELAEQKQFREASGPEQLKEWGESLGELFTQFKGWLSDAMANGLLRLEEDPVSIREERFGVYVAPSLRVIAPRGEVVRIVPKGRLVVGAQGRVDLECSPKRAMLVQKGLSHWQFAELAPDRGGWTFKDLTEESFWETLRFLLS